MVSFVTESSSGADIALLLKGSIGYCTVLIIYAVVSMLKCFTACYLSVLFIIYIIYIS